MHINQTITPAMTVTETPMLQGKDCFNRVQNTAAALGVPEDVEVEDGQKRAGGAMGTARTGPSLMCQKELRSPRGRQRPVPRGSQQPGDQTVPGKGVLSAFPLITL